MTDTGVPSDSSAARPADADADLAGEQHAVEEASQQWYRRMRAQAAKHPMTDTVWRLAVFLLGATLLLAGVLFLVFPGPGWPLIFLGLAILASEFAWANRAMHPLRRLARRLADLAKDPRYRAATVTLGVLVMAALAATAWWYVGRYGWTLDGLPNPFG